MGVEGRSRRREEKWMRSFHLLASALVLAFALAAVGGAAARSQATTIKIAASMNAANETPTPKGDVSAARGSFTATLTKSGTGGTLAWRLEFSNLTGNAVAAHIHVAARGAAGPVRVPLCAPCTSGVSGTATIDAAVLDAIENDRAYVNVHTPTNPAGEIRDQVGITASVKTTLRAGQERPRPKGKVARAKGTFSATITRTGTSGVIAWRLSFGKLTGKAVAAHIHSGVRGKSGPVIVPLCAPC
jgi:Cu/Zn superoxide dismutase